jgi:hypothetical protein
LQSKFSSNRSEYELVLLLFFKVFAASSKGRSPISVRLHLHGLLGQRFGQEILWVHFGRRDGSRKNHSSNFAHVDSVGTRTDWRTDCPQSCDCLSEQVHLLILFFLSFFFSDTFVLLPFFFLQSCWKLGEGNYKVGEWKAEGDVLGRIHEEGIGQVV